MIRQIEGLFIGCLGVFVYLFIISCFDFIAVLEKNAQVDFDVETITAGDYTMEIKLKPSQYEEF